MKTIMTDYFRGQENIAESVSKKIAKVLSCDNTDIEELFFYIISELLRNILSTLNLLTLGIALNIGHMNMAIILRVK